MSTENTNDNLRAVDAAVAGYVTELPHPTITGDDIATVMWESNVTEEEARRRLDVPIDATIPFSRPCSHTVLAVPAENEA